MGWTEEENNTAFLHRASAKSEKLKLVHSITEIGGPPFFLFFLFFSHLTERDFVALTFLTECNSTTLTPRFLPTGSATIPVSRHTTSLPILALHYGHT